MMKTERQMQKWIDGNVGVTLGSLDPTDVAVWLEIAQEETMMFFRLGEYALRERRRRLGQKPPATKKELRAYLLELRIKLQMLRDGVGDIPDAPVFDFAGFEFYAGSAFKTFQFLHGAVEGGLA